jgi:hypothetical protein
MVNSVEDSQLYDRAAAVLPDVEKYITWNEEKAFFQIDYPITVYLD